MNKFYFLPMLLVLNCTNKQLRDDFVKVDNDIVRSRMSDKKASKVKAEAEKSEKDQWDTEYTAMKISLAKVGVTNPATIAMHVRLQRKSKVRLADVRSNRSEKLLGSISIEAQFRIDVNATFNFR